MQFLVGSMIDSNVGRLREIKGYPFFVLLNWTTEPDPLKNKAPWRASFLFFGDMAPGPQAPPKKKLVTGPLFVSPLGTRPQGLEEKEVRLGAIFFWDVAPGLGLDSGGEAGGKKTGNP